MIRPTRRALVLSAWLSATTTALAASTGTQTASPLDRPLQALYAALETAMRSGRKTPFTRRFDALAPVVDEVFDLETVLKASVGPRWDSMDADVRARLLHAFRRFTIASYVANFDRSDDERFQILPGSRGFGSDRIVGTQIIEGNGDHIRVDYVMRDFNGTWRAVDVLEDGSISHVAVQRSDFRKILASGDANALIASLRRKTVDLSNGALSS